MNMLDRMITKYAKRRIIEETHAKALIENSFRRANQKLQERQAAMTRKKCPIIKGNCKTTCAHFRKGHVFEWMNTPTISNPRCKLWNLL